MVVTNRYHKVMVGWVEFAGGRLQETEAGRLVYTLPAGQEHGPHDLQGVHGETSQENVSENGKWRPVISMVKMYNFWK